MSRRRRTNLDIITVIVPAISLCTRTSIPCIDLPRGASQRKRGVSAFEEMATAYDEVKFQKLEGKLVLSSSGLSFQAGTKSLQLPWKNVIKHQLNPKSQEKSLLRIILADDKSAKLFQLKNREQLELINDDIIVRLRELPSKTSPSTLKRGRSLGASTARNGEKSIVYDNVIFRGARGAVHILDAKLKFQAGGENGTGSSSSKSFSLEYKNISKQQTSPPKLEKCLLKIMRTKDAKTLTFEVSDRTELERLSKDIQRARKKSGSVVKRPRSKSASSREAKITESVRTLAADGTITYTSIQFKSATGSLTLTDEHITFQASAPSRKMPSEKIVLAQWNQISKTQGSPASHAKVLFKVLSTDAGSFLFQLPDRSTQQQLKDDIATLIKSTSKKVETQPVTASDRSKIGDTTEELPQAADGSLPLESSLNSSKEPRSRNTNTIGNGIREKATEPFEPPEQESTINDSAGLAKASRLIVPTSSSEENGDDSTLLFDDNPTEDNRMEASEKATSENLLGDHGTTGGGSESSLDAKIALEEAPADGTPNDQVHEAIKSLTSSSTILDLLEVSSTGSNDGDFYDPRNSQTMNDLLASAFEAGKTIVEGSDSDDENGIRNLMALAGGKPANDQDDKPGTGGVHDIFDESFASLMSDTGFRMMDDEDSDDDFSVLTLDTINSKTSKNMTTTPLPKHYHDVKLKSAQGTVTLSKGHFLFKPDESTHPDTESTRIEWQEIERHHGSPQNLGKAMLKIVLQDGKSMTFKLASRKELELLRLDMTSRLHEFRKTHVSSSVLEGLIIAGSNKQTASKNAYSPKFKRLPTGAKPSSAFHPVLFEQAEGSVFLSWDQVSFQPSGLGDVDKARIVLWDSVAGYDVSLEKLTLTIGLHDRKDLTFRFSTPKELEKCEMDTTERLNSYSTFEDGSQQDLDSSDKSTDEERAVTLANAFESEVEEDDDMPENSMASLLDLSHPSDDEYDDPDSFFAHGLPPPPPPPPLPSGISHSSSDSSIKSSSSSSSSSSGGSSSTSSSSESGSSNQDSDGEGSHLD